MMVGIVNAVLEATLIFQIRGPAGQITITTVIDTGYNGALSLPLMLVIALGLTPRAPRFVTLGDGSQRMLSFYDAEVEWDGQWQAITVLCVEGDPLIGTALLSGFKMDTDFVVGGQVRITAVP